MGLGIAINQLLAEEMWKGLLDLEQNHSTQLRWEQFLHTFKGNAAYCDLPWLHDFLNQIEKKQIDFTKKISETKRVLMSHQFLSQNQNVTWEEVIYWLRDWSSEASFKIGKEIYPLTINASPKIKKQFAPQMVLPYFIHLIHNSLEHGIECPAMRKAKDKPIKGRIWLEVSQDDEFEKICFGDDGVGLPPGRLQILGSSPCPTMDKKFVWSGQGLGLYDLSQQISQFGGKVHFSSTPFQGFKVEIRIPLSQKMSKAA